MIVLQKRWDLRQVISYSSKIFVVNIDSQVSENGQRDFDCTCMLLAIV